MQAAPTDKSTLSWAFDIVVICAGALIGVFSVVSLLLARPDPVVVLTSLAVGVPLILLTARFPLVLSRQGSGIEVGFEAAVLVGLLLWHGPWVAMSVWVVAQVLSQMTTRKRLDVRLFNIGITVLCGSTGVAVMTGSGALGTTTMAELGAVALGCLVYFVTDYIISGVSVAWEDGASVVAELQHSNGVLAGLAFVGVASLGYLTALVGRELPPWSSVLLVGPLVTILVASRAVSRGGEHQRRLTALFEASATVQAARSVAELSDVLSDQAAFVLARRALGWKDSAPGADDVGVELPDGVSGPGGARWLVGPGSDRAGSSAAQDRQALEALVGVARQTATRLKLVDRLAQQARLDSLTGLPNRLLLTERLDRALGEHVGAGRIAVVYLDLDGFKSVNDRFGHSAGDDLLRSVADRLVPLVGEHDMVARLGGDEFAVLLTGVDRLGGVERLCHDILRAVHEPVALGGHTVVVGTSIGVALTSEDDDAADLMRKADMAMYRAKSLGKNQFVVYERSLGDERIARLELVEALRAGIHDELVVHYQPLVDLGSQRVVGAEALVRWQHGTTLVPPDSFIPAAEESGLIVALGQRVLEMVVDDVPHLVRAAGGPLDIAVNMSAHQLGDDGFPAQVRSAAAAFGDSRLVLEMTETVLVQDDPRTAQALHRLTASGARLAIDDFGVGYSSIGYLQHLPVSILKIDRSFVRDLDRMPRARALVEAILVMGGALDLSVVAEGIERRSQADLLHAVGCSEGQGYLFARPQPLPQFVHMLQNGLNAALRPA